MDTNIEQSSNIINTAPDTGEIQHAEIDETRQEKARELSRIRRRLSFVDMGISAMGIVLIFLLGLDVWLRNLLHGLSWQPVTGWYVLLVPCYLLILMLAYSIITAPISYYSGFVLSHRFGLSTQTFGAWLVDRLKGLAVGLIFEILVVELIYLLLAVQPNLWWLEVGVIMLLFSVVMANLAPVLLLPLFYKFTPLPDGELKQKLVDLAARANTRIKGVYTMQMSDKTTAANAALMGLGNTRRVVVGDTMVDRYTPDEIEVVLAHELGHHVHSDIWKLIVSQSLLTLIGLYVFNVVLHLIVATQHRYLSLSDPATLPLLLVLTGIFGLIIMPLTNGYSRYVEYHADEYALQSTGKVAAFKSAMTRLANQNLSELEPSPIIEFLFYDHPSIGKRLKHADNFQGVMN